MDKTFKNIKMIDSENIALLTLSELANIIPEHLIIEKCLWVGNISVDINHIDDDLTKPLDYKSVFKKMINKLNIMEKSRNK